MKRYRFLLTSLAAAAMLSLTACGTALPELTQEQHDQIVEYAAGLLLKYDANYDSGLLSEEEADKEQAKLEEKLRKEAERKKAEEAGEREKEVTQNSSDTPIVDRSEGSTQQEPVSIEQFYGLNGVTIQYTGYETVDSYPKEIAEGASFTLDATQGNKLLVLRFLVSNNSGQDITVDMGAINPKFKVSVNGGPTQNALLTMLPDDLRSLRAAIGAGEAQDAVIIVEMSEQEAGAVNEISLLLENSTGSAEALLD